MELFEELKTPTTTLSEEYQVSHSVKMETVDGDQSVCSVWQAPPPTVLGPWSNKE